MNLHKYLKRIGADEKRTGADLDSLSFLQKQHLLNVPFENLDIHWKNPIELNVGKFYKKIVKNGRGGFCYELNGLFIALLNEIGFETKIVSARVSDANGRFGEEFDHLAILTKTEGAEYLTDVGFGEFSVAPLKFEIGLEQKDENGIFVITAAENQYFEVLKQAGESWKSEYIFRETRRELNEFGSMCNFHQTSPESHFTKGIICSQMTIDGRKTLTGERFIETKRGQKTETEFDFEIEFEAILLREFNISRTA